MRLLFLATITAVAATGFARAQSGLASCYEPDFGTLLGSNDDFVFPTVTLGSPFVAFGNVYTQIEVSTNGFVWLGGLGNTDSGCCSGTGALLASGAARVCALWTDLVTDGINGSGVYHRALPGRDVITWANTFESYDPNIRFTIQLQLTVAGEVTVWFHPATTIAQIPHTGVCGLSPGGVPNPGSTDFSASFPYNSGPQTTLYEEWSTGTFDLSQRAIEFIPNAVGGWFLQDRPTCPFVAGSWTTYGAGCPLQSGISGASFYETFTGATLDLSNLQFELTPIGSVGYQVAATSNAFFSGYSPASQVPLQDDSVIDQILPFPFPNPGGVCTTAGFCSNGYVWLDNFNNGAAAAPYVPSFLSDGPRISAFWTDLDPSSGGATYFDATPTTAYFTWVSVPDLFNPSLNSTFQVQLHSDGRIVLCYQFVAVGANRPVLAGYGVGGATHDPGSIDLSASVPFVSGTGVLPVTLDWVGVPPVLGAPTPLQVGQLRPSAALGVLVLGTTQFNPGIALGGIGMPNCSAYASLDVTLAFVATPPLTPIVVPALPGNAAFVGFPIYSQVAVLDPGINALGLAASNGGTLTLGFY